MAKHSCLEKRGRDKISIWKNPRGEVPPGKPNLRPASTKVLEIVSGNLSLGIYFDGFKASIELSWLLLCGPPLPPGHARLINLRGLKLTTSINSISISSLYSGPFTLRATGTLRLLERFPGDGLWIWVKSGTKLCENSTKV